MRYTTSAALAEFDRWSRSYDRSILQQLFFGPSHQLLLKHLTYGDARVLDVGCGTGRFAVRVLEQNPEAHVWGLDLSAKMMAQGLTRCRPWRDRLHLVRGDSQRLPFPDDFFDVITCSHSFHHYPDQPAVVGEMFRVLRPGGRLMVIDGYRDGWWGWFIFDVIVTTAEGDVHHCSARRFRDLFRAAGFTELRQQIRHGPLPFLLTVGRAAKPAAVKAVPLRKVA
jgi:SAM-dependent methyltransferase